MRRRAAPKRKIIPDSKYESEIIAKAYSNDWAAAITTKVFAEENETYLLEKSDLIRTDDFFENRIDKSMIVKL